jgi:S-adenosylmethionine:tRNA ribosyltransferase-isomerase
MLCVKPRRGLSRRHCARSRDLLQPGDALVFNDTKVIPAQLEGVSNRDGQSGPNRRNAAHAVGRRTAGRPLCVPASASNPGDRLILAAMACLPEGRARCHCGRARRGRRDRADLRPFRRRRSTRRSWRAGHIPLPPYIASKRGEDARTARTTRPSMPARKARSRPPPRACISRRAVCEPGCARHLPAFRHAACGGGNLPAGQGR